MIGLYGSIIGAGSSLLGAGLQQTYGSSNMRKQHQYSKDLLKYQWDNYHTSTVNALKRAGLNVGLMYSNGGPSVSGSTGSTTAPQVGNPLTGIGELVNQSRQIDSTIDLQASQANLNDKRAATEVINKLNAEKDGLLKDVEFKQKQLNLAKTEDERRLIQQEIDESKKRIEDIDNEIMNRNKSTDADVSLKSAQTTTENDLREDKQENLRSNTRLHNADASKREFEDWYQREFGRPMSNGVNALIDYAMDILVGKWDDRSHRVDSYGDRGVKGWIERGFDSFFNQLKDKFGFLGDESLLKIAQQIWKFVVKHPIEPTRR